MHDPHHAITRRLAPAAAGLLTAILLLAGCSTGTTGASSSSRAVHPAAAPGGANGAAGFGGGGAPVQGAQAVPARGTLGAAAGEPLSAGSAARLAPAGQDIVYTASMTVRVRDVSQAAGRAARIAVQAGGYVSQEDAALDAASRAGGTTSLQLKIPVADYPAALAGLAALGRQTMLRQQAQDVAQQVADTASRVASDTAAIRQLRALLARAGSVASLLSVQEEINAQESDLEALQAQQRALDRETAYATVSLWLAGPARVTVVRHARPHAGGFAGGITAGWDALVAVVSWLLRALGATLPLGLAFALALLAALAGYRGLRNGPLGRRWLARREPRPGPGPS